MRTPIVALALVLSCALAKAQTVSLGCKSGASPVEASASSVAEAPTTVYCPPKKLVHPEYPRYAQRNNIVGTVEVELTVGAAGDVEDVKVTKSPHPSLSRAVEQAVRQWQFPEQGRKYIERRSFQFQ